MYNCTLIRQCAQIKLQESIIREFFNNCSTFQLQLHSKSKILKQLYVNNAIMDAKDREFRRNQTDIEIYIKITLGCMTIAGAAVIAEGVYVSAHSFDNLGMIFFSLVLVMGLFAVISGLKMYSIRKKLDEKKVPKEVAPKLQDELLPAKEGC
jgi:hypothetical protein